MIHKVTIILPEIKKIDLELDDELAPKTIKSFLNCLPLNVSINGGVKNCIQRKRPSKWDLKIQELLLI